VDDGLITGATMLAALHAVKRQNPIETIAAIPVAPAGRLKVIRKTCDHPICPWATSVFHSIGVHYHSFEAIDDK
jgi:predicted phosphoribosyltransferase